MGISINGILFYGIDFGCDLDDQEVAEQHGFPFDTEDPDLDFDDLYAWLMGEKPPAEDYSDGTKEAYHAHWARKRGIVGASTCVVGYHCCCDEPMRYASVRAGHYQCTWGDPTEIPDGLAAKPEWRDQLKEYCELMKLPFQEPKWWLVSMRC